MQDFSQLNFGHLRATFFEAENDQRNGGLPSKTRSTAMEQAPCFGVLPLWFARLNYLVGICQGVVRGFIFRRVYFYQRKWEYYNASLIQAGCRGKIDRTFCSALKVGNSKEKTTNFQASDSGHWFIE